MIGQILLFAKGSVDKHSILALPCLKTFTCILTNVHTFSSFTKKTFNGVGLSSAVLVNLQPFADYTAQVTCGSLEHFYKWGDWSEITKFSTKEDIDLIANGETGEPLLVQNLLSSIMSVWLLCALLFSPIGRAEQDGQPVSIKEVELYAEETFCERPDCGTWVLNIIWRDEFAENDKSEKVSYDIEVIRTEQMRTVHFETIHVMANKTGYYHWKWTSSIPLQCTSHSVRLRRRDQDHIGEWTQLYTYKGKDLNATTTGVYPQHKPVMVGSNITFCCIVERDQVPLPKFLIQISNRTYISDPVHFDEPRVSAIHCGGWKGSMVFIGYPPDDQNLVCVTRDLSSVECNWNVGRNTHLTHNRKTNYTLNGRNCEPGNCNQHALMKQKTKWTLIAKNPLGVKTLIDEADPTERVWLRAPSKISHIANARNVTLRWSWDEKNYTLFLMICQVKLNGNIYNVGVIRFYLALN